MSDVQHNGCGHMGRCMHMHAMAVSDLSHHRNKQMTGTSLVESAMSVFASFAAIVKQLWMCRQARQCLAPA